MLNEILPVVAATAGIIGVILGLRSQVKGPHITFTLRKEELILFEGEHDEHVTLLLAGIANKKHRFFGETAKRISGEVIYRAPLNDGKLGLNCNVGLPWLKASGARIKTVEQLKSGEDIQKALEKYSFDRTEKDLPRGRGELLVVAYGIEKINKIFLASVFPIEIPLPPPEKTQWTLHGFPFRLEIAGENLSSTLSPGTMLIASSWDNWTYPAKVTTLRTPSKVRNMLLHMGFRRKVKVLGSETT